MDKNTRIKTDLRNGKLRRTGYIYLHDDAKAKKKENFRFLTNQKGKKLGVLLSLKAYEELIKDLHDISMVLKRKDEELISFEEIKKELNVSDIP